MLGIFFVVSVCGLLVGILVGVLLGCMIKFCVFLVMMVDGVIGVWLFFCSNVLEMWFMC